MLWRRMVLALSLLLNAVLLYSLVWGEKGIIAYRELRDEYMLLSSRIESFNVLNLELSREIRLLQTDDKYVEKMIRKRLKNYVRDNEIVYIFPEKAVTSAGAAPDEAKD